MKGYVCTLLIVLFFPALAISEDLPNTHRQMHTAGFWISQHPSPDQVILTPKEIVQLNERIQNELKLTKDIFVIISSFKTESLMEQFDAVLNSYTNKGYCLLSGERNSQAFIDEMRRNMNLPGIVLGIAPRYGLVTEYANVRFLPTSKGLYESPGDVDFDQLQNSSLDVGAAVAVVHQSLDKKWYYCLTSTADGWVEADRIVLGDPKVIREYAQTKTFGVVTKPKGDIYLDPGLTRHHSYVRMGTRLPLVGDSGREVSVLIPRRDKDNKLEVVQGYMDSSDIHDGYLPYTPRVILTQALSMLNQPYGWGGMYGEQDCSAFLGEVFSTVGVVLPRDSKDQAKVGQALVTFEDNAGSEMKFQAFKDVFGGSVILPMKGHIMLYLGSIDGKPYAIHAIWAYRESKAGRDVPRILNRVVVSDLTLGEGSRKGSLINRLSKIVEIK